MLYKKRKEKIRYSLKERIRYLLSVEYNLDFLMTTSIALLLTITGVYISHSNSDKFTGRVRIIDSAVTSKEYISKVKAEACSKTKIITLDE